MSTVAVWQAVSPENVNLEALARLMIVAWAGQPTADGVARRAEALQAELEGLDPTRRALLVAGDPASPVGFCRTWRDEADEDAWWFVALVVEPNRRRQGVGTALARKVETYARDHGGKTLRSEVHADNAASIGFHEAIGFVNEGQFTAADGDRLIAFHRRLA